VSNYKDIIYEVGANAVRITINRPEVMNAFRLQTVEELIDAFKRADEEKSVNAIVFGGAGEKAFCTGGDQKVHLSEDGLYGPRGTIASEKAQFGQVGPKVGSVDPGFGTAFLSRHIGEKRAREVWFLCRRYTAQQAYEMGLVNKVVPHDQLDAEVEAWAAEINVLSPTAIAIAKRSFNADSENIRGISYMGIAAVKGFYQSEESKEGVRAFNERRKPDFKKHA